MTVIDYSVFSDIMAAIRRTKAKPDFETDIVNVVYSNDGKLCYDKFHQDLLVLV